MPILKLSADSGFKFGFWSIAIFAMISSGKVKIFQRLERACQTGSLSLNQMMPYPGADAKNRLRVFIVEINGFSKLTSTFFEAREEVR